MKLAVVFFLGALLSGCNTTGYDTTRPNLDNGDNTGKLGSPIRRASPADVYVDLGTEYLRQGNIQESFTNARKAVLVDPRSASGHNLLGVVYQRLGQIPEAGVQFQIAVKLEPRNPYALNAYGSFLCGQRQFEKADETFKRALKNPLYPTPWVAWHNAGLCAEESSNLIAAEQNFRNALQMNPRFTPALFRMAQISFEQENYLSTRAYLQRFGQIVSHTAGSLWLGVRTEKQLGDRDQVASYILKLKAKFPDSEQAKYLNGA